MNFITGIVGIVASLCLMISGGVCAAEEEFIDREYQFSHHYFLKGENGYYFVPDAHVFYWEEGMEEAVPLCSKVDCLHQYETDWQKKRECEAYIGPATWNTLYIYDNKLYVLGRAQTVNAETIQYVMDLDGSNRKRNEEYDEYKYKPLFEPRYHKGYLYFATSEVTPLGKGQVREELRLCRQIVDRSEEPEVLYEMSKEFNRMEEVFGGLIAPMHLYEDYVYFATEREDGSFQQYVYCLQERELKKLSYLYEDAVNMMVRGFYEDKMIYSYCFETEDREEGRNVYISNLDGSEEELLLTGKPYFFFAGMDERYVYLDDAQCEEIVTGRKHTRTIYIYDKHTGELLWEYDMLNATLIDCGCGDEKYLFYLGSGYQVYALLKESLIPGQEPITKELVRYPESY